ncbi:MAG TPA: ABC transporter substrate-binding protein [Caulobacteraceae bacterium]|jgi:iron complex transport system substrate-binding protein
MAGRLAAVALAVLAGLPATGAQARPLRVMSISDCGDQLVLALLPPSQVTSVTWLSRDPESSAMAPAARKASVNHGLAEEVLRDRPDLVIAGTYTTPAARALLQKLHFPLLELGPVNSFDDIRRQTRQVAAAVGASARGEQLIGRMDATLRRLAAQRGPPLRVVAWDGGGFAAPPGSMYDALLKAAGARNVAAEPGGAGASVERLLAARPDLLIEDAPATERPGLRTAVLDNPAVRRLWGDRTVVLPARDYECGTPFSADGALRLSEAMRATAARARPLPAP